MNNESSERKEEPAEQKIIRREVITDQSDPRMIKFREENGEFKPGYPRKTIKLVITEYAAGPNDSKVTTHIGYYEGEPPPEYKAFLRMLLDKAMDSDKKE